MHGFSLLFYSRYFPISVYFILWNKICLSISSNEMNNARGSTFLHVSKYLENIRYWIPWFKINDFCWLQIFYFRNLRVACFTFFLIIYTVLNNSFAKRKNKTHRNKKRKKTQKQNISNPLQHISLKIKFVHKLYLLWWQTYSLLQNINKGKCSLTTQNIKSLTY